MSAEPKAKKWERDVPRAACLVLVNVAYQRDDVLLRLQERHLERMDALEREQPIETFSSDETSFGLLRPFGRELSERRGVEEGFGVV